MYESTMVFPDGRVRERDSWAVDGRDNLKIILFLQRDPPLLASASNEITEFVCSMPSDVQQVERLRTLKINTILCWAAAHSVATDPQQQQQASNYY